MNNFDSNSEHENIEFNVSYDGDLSCIYFEEFEQENTRIKFSRDSSLFIIGDVDKPLYKKTQLNKMTKDELIELDQKFQLLCPYDYSEIKKSYLIDELKEVTIKKYYEYLVSEYSWRDINDYFEHDYYISRGHSQGDAIYVVNVDEAFTKETKENIDHIFWDAPVYISIEIGDNDEIRELDLLDDVYEYDKDEVMSKIMAMNDVSDYAKEWLQDNLPTSPTYSY